MTRCLDLNIEKEKKNLLDQIKSQGGRITAQRKSIIEALLSFHTPFSADDLYQKVKTQKIDLATVYRSISSLIELHQLTSIDFQDGVQRYEYQPKSHKHHHHHVICKVCKDVEPIDLCLSSQQIQQVRNLGYTDVSHSLEFFAVCSKCK